MTIDIRANVYCSIGPVIQGSFADDHLQGSGLVRTRGSVELAGIYRPDIGQVVEFAWTRGGIGARLPRKLRVLSCFADPFRRITTVQLGCKLTMFEDVTPNLQINNQFSGTAITARLYAEDRIAQKRAQTGGIFVPTAMIPTEDAERAALLKEYQYLRQYVNVPLNGKRLVEYICGLMKVELAQAVPLVNHYGRVKNFDLSNGYLQILSDLLVSESYFGYLNESEQLVIRSLDTDAGTGPVVDASTIIDLSPIGVGNRPGEGVVVSYQKTRSLKRDAAADVGYDPTGAGDEQLDPADPGDPVPDPPPPPPAQPVDPLEDVTGWTEDRTIGFPVTVPIEYTTQSGEEVSDPYTYTPVSTSTTTYRNGKQQRSVQTSTKPLWAAAPAYVAQRLSFGLSAPNAQCETRTETVYTYDAQGREQRITTDEYESAAELAGGLSLQYVFEDIDGGGNVTLGNETIWTGRTVVEKFYAGNFEKTTTSQFRHWAKGQQGQQNASESRLVFETAARTVSFLDRIFTDSLEFVGMEVVTRITSPENQLNAADPVVNSDRPDDAEDAAAPATPEPADLERQAYGKPSRTKRYGRDAAGYEVVEETATLLYTYGTVTTPDRIIKLSLPYTADDVFVFDQDVGFLTGYQPTTFTGKLGNVMQQALTFGRVQNRLLLGNRQGVSLQLAPELLPVAPFDPIYIKAEGLTGQYRVNGASWTFSRDGIVSSVDALFWGGVGS